jgi:hypothetical protein
MKPTKESYLYTKILFFAHKDTYLFLQVLPHSLLGMVVCGAGRPPDTPDRPSCPPDKGQTGVD